MEGYLTLSINFFTPSSKYYFLLFHEYLIFSSKKGGQKIGSFSLKISTITLTPDDPLSIHIHNGVQNVKLKASTIGEKIRWVILYIY
jgi:oxysterol-binding protein 1